MLFHPRGSRLTDYAVGELSDRHAEQIKRHLARCARCRRIVSGVRKLVRDGTRRPDPVPPPALLDGIVQAAERGRSVILPVADPPPRLRTSRAFVGLVAVLIGAVSLVASALWVGELRADRSEVRFADSVLHPGEDVRVTYRGVGMFDDVDRVVLRARYRTKADEPYASPGRLLVAGELRRVGPRTFEGTARLPSDAVYAAFAVEDPAGRTVDHNRLAFWELLAYANGRPSFDALLQKLYDHMGRNWRVVHEVATRLTTLYPDHPASWAQRLGVEQLADPGGFTDSLTTMYRQRLTALDRHWSTQAHIPGDYLAWLYALARMAAPEDSALAAKWRRRLVREAPQHPVAITERILAVRDWENPHRYLRNLEVLWADMGPNGQVALSGYSAATRAGDPEVILRWSTRLESLDPLSRPAIARRLATIPALRDEGIRRLRRQITVLDDTLDARPLGRTVAWYREQRDSRRKEMLAALGEALIEDGEHEAGLVALEPAVQNSWNLEAFERLASARMTVGDTAGAVRYRAAMAVDPNTPRQVSDWLAGTSRALVGDSAWTAMLRAARERMYVFTLAKVKTVPISAGVRVHDRDGTPHTWQSLVRDRVTVVGTVSPYMAAPPRVQRLREALAQSFGDRVQMIGLAVEARPASAHTQPPLPDLDLPVFEDRSGRVRETFNVWAFPAFFVVDGDGRLRFDEGTDQDVLRQVATLLALEEESVVADSPAGPG